MSLLYVIDMCLCVATEVKDLYVTLIRNDKHHYNMQNPCRKHQLCISCLYCYGQGTVFFFLKLFGNPWSKPISSVLQPYDADTRLNYFHFTRNIMYVSVLDGLQQDVHSTSRHVGQRFIMRYGHRVHPPPDSHMIRLIYSFIHELCFHLWATICKYNKNWPSKF